jgi:histidinol-phosphatase
VDRDLAFALRLADAADEITLRFFQTEDLRWETKADRTPVSVADSRVEETFRQIVKASRRSEGVHGEEFGDEGFDRKWIVDPIDGTAGYVRGVPIWATLIAYEVDGQVEVAVASAPALSRRWWAARGKGAFVNGRAIRVSDVSSLARAGVSATSTEVPGWGTLVARSGFSRRLGDFWQHCLVAEGALDVAVDGPYMQIWDYAAPSLIVQEAGGRFSTFRGEAPYPGSTSLSTNGLLHEQVMSLLLD